jgi:hypothetical protein
MSLEKEMILKHSSRCPCRRIYYGMHPQQQIPYSKNILILHNITFPYSRIEY